MIGKIIESVVGTGGDIARRYQEGKITIAEAEKELAVLGLALEGKVVEGQVGLNMKDAESTDPVRTRWRPLGAIALLSLLVVNILAATFDGPSVSEWGLFDMSPEAAEARAERIKALLWIVSALFGIREGGKAFGNR